MGPSQQGPFPQAQQQVSEGVLQSIGPTTQPYHQQDPRFSSQQQMREHYLQQQQQYIQQQHYLQQLQQHQQLQYQMQQQIHYQQQEPRQYMQQQQMQPQHQPVQYMHEAEVQQQLGRQLHPTAEQGYVPQPYSAKDEYSQLHEDYSFNPFYSYMKEQNALAETREEAAAQEEISHVPDNNKHPLQGEKFHPSHNRSLSDSRAAMAGAGAGPPSALKSQLVTPKMIYRSIHRSPSDPSFAARKVVDNQATGQLVNFDSVEESKENWNPFSPFYDGNSGNIGLCTGDDDDFASLRSEKSSSEGGDRKTNIHQEPQNQSKDLFGAAVFGAVNYGQGRNVKPISNSQENLPSCSQTLENVKPLENTDLSNEKEIENYGPKNVVNPRSSNPFGSAPFGLDGPPEQPSPTSPDIFGQAPFDVQKSERRVKKKQQNPDGGMNCDVQSSGRSDMFGLQPFSTDPHLDKQSEHPHNMSSLATEHFKRDPEPFELESSSNKEVDEFGATSFSGNPQNKDISFESDINNLGLVNPATTFSEHDDPFSGVPFNPTISSKSDKLARRNARRGQQLSQTTDEASRKPGATRTRRQLPKIPTNQMANQAGQQLSMQGLHGMPVRPSGGSPRLIQKQN